MNIVGIIAEYNPMHNGHIFNIQKAKELAKADFVIVIMSGSYTEQGNVSVISKMDKASLAIENGADMVIELPTIYATSSSENFAYGAVKILNSLGVVTHIAFGVESDNLIELQDVANLIVENKNEIVKKIKEQDKNINSAQAFSNTVSNIKGYNISDLFTPNNILAIEYLKAIKALESQIKPVLIKRVAANHNDDKISLDSKYTSSTSIRNTLWNTTLTNKEKFNIIKKSVPKNTFKYLSSNRFNSNEDMWNILKYKILTLGIDGLKDIYEISEGLEKRIYNMVKVSNNYNEFILNVKTKRYTLSRIKRICVYIILGITKDLQEKISNVNYIRVLKVKSNSLKLLSQISKNATIPLITKLTEKDISKYPEDISSSLKLDILANDILNNTTIGIDYTNKIKQP